MKKYIVPQEFLNVLEILIFEKGEKRQFLIVITIVMNLTGSTHLRWVVRFFPSFLYLLLWKNNDTGLTRQLFWF